MTDNNIIAILTALGAPILVFIGGLVSWLLKTRKEELKAIEERAMERRIDTYNILLHPFIVLLSNKATEKTKDKALGDIGNVDYKRAAFNLTTFGSDKMVIAYNNMMQSFYKNEMESNPKETMRKFAIFLLSIRKDLYDKNTKLNEWDMLKSLITDIDKLITKTK